MSIIITKILPRFMPKKRLEAENNIPVLINETCIAEATHVIAAILGFGCVFVWNGIGGWIVSVLFLLINVPFVIIQRFNRPRLVTADMMLKRRNGLKLEASHKKGSTEEEKDENFTLDFRC